MVKYIRRQERARRQQGAIFVEGLVVGGMLILFIILLWAIFNLTSAKHQALSEARSAAWTYALNGCGDDNVTTAYDDIHERSKEPGDVCAGEDCADGEQVAGLTPGGCKPARLVFGPPGTRGNRVPDHDRRPVPRPYHRGFLAVFVQPAPKP